MAMQRVRTLQAFLMCLMMVLSVQSMGLSALLDAGSDPSTSGESPGPTSSHEHGASDGSMAPMDGGVAREESVLDSWNLGPNLTEGTTIVFGPVGSVSPTGMRHLCWIDDQGQVHHGRLAEDNTWTDGVSASWSTSVVTTVDNVSDSPACAVSATTDDLSLIHI